MALLGIDEWVARPPTPRLSVARVPRKLVLSALGDLNQMNSGVYCVPAWLRDDSLGKGDDSIQSSANLSPAAQSYLDHLGLGVDDLFHHALAVLHDPAYREANAGALRMEWPRIPLPGWPDGDSPGAADELSASAAQGREFGPPAGPRNAGAGRDSRRAAP